MSKIEESKDSFLTEYIPKIENFLEMEINHLNKFKLLIDEIKEKSQKNIQNNKMKNNQKKISPENNNLKGNII